MCFCFGVFLLIAFVMWTLGVYFIDVQHIGPQGSSVGFATVNGFFHRLTGVHMLLYTVTDWLGIVPVCVALCFAVLGLIQWIKRKNMLKVDYSILALGVFYVIVMVAYFLFESIVINYRPVLINGYLETSYPSSTTLLVTCVMPTAILQLKSRIRNVVLRKLTVILVTAFTVFMVMGRLVSGVHWLSDIIGALLLSIGLVMMYYSLSKL